MSKSTTTARFRSRIGRLRIAARSAVAATVVLVMPVLASDTAEAQAVLAQVESTPTSADFPGGSMVQKIVNWAAQFGLWGSVVSILVGAGIWGISQQFGNGYQAGKGKMLAGAGAAGAVFVGLAPIIVNTLFNAAGS